METLKLLSRDVRNNHVQTVGHWGHGKAIENNLLGSKK